MSKIEILPIFPSFKASDIVKEKREEFKAKTKRDYGPELIRTEEY